MHRTNRGRPGRSGDTVIVTGSSTGLGLESALQLASRGFRVFATVRDPDARPGVLQAAADQWNVPASELTVANGIITHAASGRTTSYGKVAGAAAKVTPPELVGRNSPA